MNARDLLAELDAASIVVTREGDDLKVRGAPGVSLAPYVERIRQHKPALLCELLQDRIVAILAVAPEHFDRTTYDALWCQWHMENAQ